MCKEEEETTPNSSSTTATNDDSSKNAAPRQVNYPAVTWDYRLTKGPRGLGVAANRNIKKGELVFGDSYEFLFTEIQDGDVLRLDRHDKASRKCQADIPSTFPLTREVLSRTHGVPAMMRMRRSTSNSDNSNTEKVVSWHLEVPGMLINHSCDPNVVDDSHDDAKGEAYAVRDIKKGEELCYDYTFQYYDHGPFFETCLCGARNCRGSMMGFKALTDEEKQKVLPYASEAVKAMHEADIGKRPPVQKQQIESPPRMAPPPIIDNGNNDNSDALRLVVPGPSHACADVIIQMIEDEKTSTPYALYAARYFAEGEQVYEFWTQLWPQQGKVPIDMVFSKDLLPGDLPESTTVRVHALECGRKNRAGKFVFSGWDMFTTHSCNPNLVYNDKDEDEDDDWRGTYAARPILKGEQLTVDLNTVLWDRTRWKGLGDGICTCGAANCRGTVKGFKFLSREDQEELKSMDWKRSLPPHDATSGKKRVTPGEALVPHVRVNWRKYTDDAPDSASSDSSSSEEESSDEEKT